MSALRGVRHRWVLACKLVGALIVLSLAGCGTAPTGPSFDDLWIYGYYAWLPDRSAGGEWVACSVEVLDCAGGSVVEGLDVRCNGVRLVLDWLAYTGDPGDVRPGETVTFTVSNGHRTLRKTLEVPAAPTGLVLAEGSWSFSSGQGSHTLSWSNPAAVGDTLLIALVGHFAHPAILAARSFWAPPTATSVTLANADMGWFAGTTRVECAVFQARRGEFAGHSGESALWARAGVRGSWPTHGRAGYPSACPPN